MNENHPIFFLVKNRALGDSVLGLSSVSYLKKLYPKSTIIYAVPQWTAKLYQDVKTDADLIYPLKLNTLEDILNLYTDLINFKIDAIHEMHQTGTGKTVFSLFSVIKNIPYTFHNHHKNSGTKVIDQGEKKELIQRDLDGIYSFYGKHLALPNFLNFEPQIYTPKLTPKNRIILGVVATRKTKMWPLENYIKLADELLNSDPRLEIAIPLSLSKEDQFIKIELEKLTKNSRIKMINLPLNELPNFFAESSFYIGNDTGLKHIACSVGLKTITLFGPEPIREWHPYDQKKHKVQYIENLACRTRTHHYCGLSICDLPKKENMQCMNGITVEKVLLQLRTLSD